MFSSSDRDDTRTIIAYTLWKTQKEGCGYIQPVAELVDGKLVAISKNDFCETQRVFITSGFEALENKYQEKKFFQIKINISNFYGEKETTQGITCKYVAIASNASDIRQKDFFEIIESILPDPNAKIISSNISPGTVYVFVRDSSYIYGPFKWKYNGNEQIELDFVDAPLPGVKLAPYQCYKIEFEKINGSIVVAMNSNKIVMQDLSIPAKTEFFDYASDDEIVRFCTKVAAEQKIRNFDRSKAEELEKFVKNNQKLNHEFYKKRFHRLSEIAKISDEARQEISKSIPLLLNSAIGQEFIQEHIINNEAKFLEKLKKDKEKEINAELKKLEDETVKSKQRIAELNIQKTDLHNDIGNLKNEKTELEKEIQELAEGGEESINLNSIHAETDTRLLQKRQELNNLEDQIEEFCKIKEIKNSIHSLELEKEIQNRERDRAKKEREAAELSLEKIKDQLRDKTGALQSELIKLKPFVDAISGSLSYKDEDSKPIFVKTQFIEKTDLIKNQQEYIIRTIRTALDKKGRYFSEHQIANLLITTQQSFLTFFAGLPGTGKTSLARLIADAQNINLRFNEVAVSRGWTSQKDLIGYYNPLINRFQSASTGMYSFLKSICCEENDKSQAMAYILLDEANLSPIEHYWSAFMGISDHESERNILLGNEKFNIPNNLRFIATINYDATTEPLSPRLINRAPVIVLESNEEEIKQIGRIDNEEAIKNLLPCPALQMDELFGLADDIPKFDAKEQIAYDNIRNVLQKNSIELGRPIFVSHRKENAIRQYLGKARRLMCLDTDLMAFDFAVRQYILPLIQGNGKSFGKRLEMLKEILVENELIGSTNTLERIIAFGQSDLDTYDFFCW